MNGAPDAGALAAIHAEAFEAPWDRAAFESLLAQAGVFAVTEADGFILVRRVADEADILTLAVRPSARRRGLASRLTFLAVSAVADQGGTQLFLEVAEDNAAARALYARAGFAEVGRRPGYYARPDGSRRDALLLALNLIDPLP